MRFRQRPRVRAVLAAPEVLRGEQPTAASERMGVCGWGREREAQREA